MKNVLVVAAAAALGACGYLAAPIQSVTKAKFDVPLFGHSDGPATLNGPTVSDLKTTVTLSAGMPFHLPAGDTTPWGPILGADARLKAAGLPGTFSLTVEQVQLTGEADIEFQVSSKDAKVLGKKLGGAITSPASCTMHVTATTEAQALQDGLGACLTDWVAANGMPVQFDMLIGQDLPPQGQGESSSDFNFSWVQTLHADNALEMGCGAVEMPKVVQQDAKNLVFSDMSLSGYGASTADVSLFAFALAYDAHGNPQSSAYMSQAIGGGQLYWIEQEVEKKPDGFSNYTVAGTVHPSLSPAMPDFLEKTVTALAGDGTAGGYGYACWMVNGAAPRDGFIDLQIAGVGSYALTPDQL